MRIIFFAGLPGSGKSTIAHALAEKLRVQIVDVDDFKKQVGTRTDGLDPPELRWQYYRLALDHILELFKQGAHTVVVDEMFHVASLRARIETTLKGHQISVRWIEVQCPHEEVERRFTKCPRHGHILNTEGLLKIREEVARIFDPFDHGDTCHLLVNTGPIADAVARAEGFVHAH